MSFADEIAIRTLWGEARGEPDEGVKAVAHVILNRVQDGQWGPNAAVVCLWPMQFSCWNIGDPNRAKILRLDDGDTELARCQSLYADALSEPDNTDGACFYFAEGIPVPDWAKRMRKTVQIGHHIFFSAT